MLFAGSEDKRRINMNRNICREQRTELLVHYRFSGQATGAGKLIFSRWIGAGANTSVNLIEWLVVRFDEDCFNSVKRFASLKRYPEQPSSPRQFLVGVFLIGFLRNVLRPERHAERYSSRIVSMLKRPSTSFRALKSRCSPDVK